MRNLIRVLKALLIVFFLVFVYIQVKQPALSTADFDTVSETLVKDMEQYSLEQQDNISIKKYLSIQPDEFESILYYKSSDPMDVREIVIVKFKDTNQQNSFKEMMQNRVDSQINAFDGYGLDQVALLKEANISVDMNFGLYVTSENSDDILKLYKSLL